MWLPGCSNSQIWAADRQGPTRVRKSAQEQSQFPWHPRSCVRSSYSLRWLEHHVSHWCTFHFKRTCSWAIDTPPCKLSKPRSSDALHLVLQWSCLHTEPTFLKGKKKNLPHNSRRVIQKHSLLWGVFSFLSSSFYIFGVSLFPFFSLAWKTLKRTTTNIWVTAYFNDALLKWWF